MLEGEHSDLSTITEDRRALLTAARVREEEALADLAVARERLAGQDVVIWDLRNAPWQVQEVATQSSKQLGKVLSVRDEASSHGYLKDLDRLRTSSSTLNVVQWHWRCICGL